MSEIKKVYFHIGYPKTGTTFLQNDIFPNIKEINFINNSLIIKELNKIIYQDYYSFNALEVRNLINERLTSQINLISCESLIGDFFSKLVNSRLIADKIAHIFPTAKIIITLRNQYSFIESMYKQYIHEGGIKTFKAFINYSNNRLNSTFSIRDVSINPEMLDYCLLIDYYIGLFGKENIYVSTYEDLVADPNHFIKQLFFWMGISHYQNVSKIKYYNIGYGKIQIFLARLLNRFLKSKFKENAILPVIPFTRKLRLDYDLVRKTLQSKLSFTIFRRFSINNTEIKLAMSKYYKASNEKLVATFGNQVKKIYFDM